MGSELRSQNFDLVTFREIFPKTLVMGPSFLGTLTQNSPKVLSLPAKPKLDSELWPNS